MAVLVTALVIVLGLAAVLYGYWLAAQPTARTLHGAVVNYPEDVPKLLSRGEEIDGRNADAMTPLMMAATFGNPDSTSQLLDLGADPNLEDSRGRTALLIATFPSKCDRNAALIRALLETGADPNVHEPDDHHTPLHKAVWGNSRVVVDELIAHGADVNAPGKFDRTPLHMAVSFDKTGADIVQALVDAAADLEAPMQDGNTPLHLAVATGSYEKVEILLDAGASPIAENDYGMLPLHQRRSDSKMAELFERISSREQSDEKRPRDETDVSERTP